MKIVKNSIVVLIIVIALLGLKFIFFPSSTKGIKNTNNNKAAAVVTVTKVHYELLNEKIYTTGTVLSNEEVDLKPEIAGKVTGIYFKEGETVTKNQLLVKINDQDIQAQLKKLELQKKLAEDSENRQKQLLEVKGISQQEYDAYLNQLNAIKADIEYNQAQIAKTEIRASFTGTIGLKYISEGSYINQTTKIASILQLNPLKIDFSIPEKYAAVIKRGEDVTVIPENSNESLKATIYAIEPKIDINTRTLQIRALYKNEKNTLYPGTFVKLELPVTKNEKAIMIPTEAVIPELKGKKVFITKNGKATPVRVVTGVRTDTKVQILKGLEEGDSVIVTGIMQLKPDIPVKVIQAK